MSLKTPLKWLLDRLPRHSVRETERLLDALHKMYDEQILHLRQENSRKLAEMAKRHVEDVAGMRNRLKAENAKEREMIDKLRKHYVLSASAAVDSKFPEAVAVTITFEKKLMYFPIDERQLNFHAAYIAHQAGAAFKRFWAC